MRQKKNLMKNQSHNLLSAARRTQRLLEPPTITLTQLDACIAGLYLEYQRIITTQSFQKHTTRTGQQDLAFVCFFVILLTVRQLGWRCSEITRCRLDAHDGKFMLVVKEELKELPDKRLILSIDEMQPAILQEALRSYAEVVYPFLLTVSDRPLGKRIFLSCSLSGIAPFNDASQFKYYFRINMRRFLPLQNSQALSFHQLLRLVYTASEPIEKRMIKAASALDDKVGTVQKMSPTYTQLRMLAKAMPKPVEKLMIEAAQALGDEVDTVKKTYPTSRKRKLSQ